MKKIIASIVIIIFATICTVDCNGGEKPSDIRGVSPTLIYTLSSVESGGSNPDDPRGLIPWSGAVGDNGQAVGILQIHPAYVDDVNRIIRNLSVDEAYRFGLIRDGKRIQFTLQDRLNMDKSERMVEVYLRHYGNRYQKLTGKPATLEIMSRIHNGGPDGWKKPSTVDYAQKVRIRHFLLFQRGE